MGIHPESFNEREHCWTDYESPSSPPGLQPEFPWPPPDWEHRARAAEHRFLAVWSAAATAAVVGLRTAQQRKREFFADRPFLFVVYDFEHGVTLFAGKVVNPNNDNVIQTRAALIQEPGAAPASPSVADSKMFRDFPNSL